MPGVSGDHGPSGSATLNQCPFCLGHFKIRRDGSLCRHGGRFKGEECPGSFKAPACSATCGAKNEAPIDCSSATEVVSSKTDIPLVTQYEAILANLANKLKFVKVYEHVPKASRDSVAGSLTTMLVNLCEDPCNPDHWIRLACLFPFVLSKPARGGRRLNPANIIIKKLNIFKNLDLDSLVDSFVADHREGPRDSRRGSWTSAVTEKIEQGNFRSAVQLLCSAEGLAEDSPSTLLALRTIHPKVPADRRVFPVSEPTCAILTPNQVLKALKSFKNGSSGGLDGLRPQHLKDLVAAPFQMDNLLSAVTQFMNLLLKGVCPPTMASFFSEAVWLPCLKREAECGQLR